VRCLQWMRARWREETMLDILGWRGAFAVERAHLQQVEDHIEVCYSWGCLSDEGLNDAFTRVAKTLHD
jgi:hypothetical protein